MSPFFSILVPSFNSKQYIYECINSIINQNFDDYEILICDQGNTDSSFLLTNPLFSKRIRIIYKACPSAYLARVELFMNATGKYVLFLDSDDLYKKGFLKKMYEIIQETKEADLYHFNLERFMDTQEINNSFTISNIVSQKKEFFLDLLLSSSNYNSVSTKCYKNKGFENYEFYDVSYSKSSDKLMNVSLIRPVESIFYIDFAPYLYRKNNDSITNQINLDFINQNSFCCLWQHKYIWLNL